MSDDTRVVVPVDERRVRQIVAEMFAERPSYKAAPFHLFHRWSPWGGVIVTEKGRPLQSRICVICHFEQMKWL